LLLIPEFQGFLSVFLLFCALDNWIDGPLAGLVAALGFGVVIFFAWKQFRERERRRYYRQRERERREYWGWD
jgi:hypothetical protein